MDISGYSRGGRGGRSAHLMQSTWAYHSDPAGKRKRQKGLSTGARAVLLLLFLGAAWAGIRRAMRHEPAAATNGGGGSKADAAASGNAARGGAGKAADQGAAAAAKGGKGAAPVAKAPVDPALAAKLDAALEARIERMMRITPAYRGVGKVGGWGTGAAATVNHFTPIALLLQPAACSQWALRWHVVLSPNHSCTSLLQVDTFPHLGDASRVLLASSGRLAWYRYDTDELRVLHEGAVSGGAGAVVW